MELFNIIISCILTLFSHTSASMIIATPKFSRRVTLLIWLIYDVAMCVCFIVLLYNPPNMMVNYLISFLISFLLHHIIYFLTTTGAITQRLFLILFYDTLYTITLGIIVVFNGSFGDGFTLARSILYATLIIIINFVYLKKIVPQLVENIDSLKKENIIFCVISGLAFISVFFQAIISRELLMESTSNQIVFILSSLFIISVFPLVNTLCTAKGEAVRINSIEYLAYYDSLTNVLNRRAGSDLIDRLLDQSRGKSIGALFVLDVDKFKYVNDTYGHNEGDLLLQSLAKTLTNQSGADVVCRIGGDEFVLFYNKLTTPVEINDIAEKLFNDIQQNFDNNQYWNTVSISIGIKLRNINDDDYLKLFIAGDKAMYRSKKSADRQHIVIV